MKTPKNILVALLILLVILLAAMYRNAQHRRNRLSIQNRVLASDYNNILQKNEQLSRAYRQLLSHQDFVRQGQSSFIDERKYYRQNWQNFIHVSTDNYRTGIIGGIHGLKIRVENQADFLLDNVQVSITYREAGGGVFKTESVNINDVPALGSKTAAAPGSPRGMSIQLQIMRITSQEMNFCYSVNKTAGGNSGDPYPCVASGK